jgi:hypothetical protein
MELGQWSAWRQGCRGQGAGRNRYRIEARKHYQEERVAGQPGRPRRALRQRCR